nr:immunoglobulin heavy chain junction region [Mus musculus]MBK4184532.1 immunoglobulin heavy chain junction region [Mus musculus]MBK4184533.1 immunoglobulin heavy chain junction region [Mus musculus]MBK4184534.1 immunoglobulin heavy chain junction region [Mus musculus]MBK4184535.1 immunoglobulin heavy chain junction region [Mus musculus]
CARKRAWFAYW